MARKRIYEIAHELGVSSKDLIAKLEEMGISEGDIDDAVAWARR